MSTIRTGLGFDAHRYTQGEGIVVGGVLIPCDKAIVAHSDGDVLLHALCDAILGAAALGDIGGHFPNNETYKNCSSRDLLRQVMQLLKDRSMNVVNSDAVLIAETPRFSSFIQAIRQNIAQDIELDIEQVSVKATTTDQMGFTGRQEGIAVMVSILLEINR